MLGAIILIGLGVIFWLVQNFAVTIGDLWPFFIILPGLVFLFFALTGGKNTLGLIFPGLMVTGTGVILLVQSITGHWESWAYVWAVYPALVGVGIIFMGRRTEDSRTYSVGRGLLTGGLVALLVLGAFFELLIFGGLGAIGNYVWPVLLILLGVWLLLQGGRTEGCEAQAR
jgi:hypothetical protein